MRFGVSYCTDLLVEANRRELEAVLGPFVCDATDFRAAATWLTPLTPSDASTRAAAHRVLARHGRMELLLFDAPYDERLFAAQPCSSGEDDESGCATKRTGRQHAAASTPCATARRSAEETS